MISIREMNVLICDDMVNMCQSIHKMMRVIGFGKTFDYAYDGQEGWKALQNGGIDLMLLDYNMPVMTGAELLNRVRENRELRYLPVVMISGNAHSDYVAEIAESHVDAFILKPLTIKVLETKINQVIDRANNPPPMIEYLCRAKEYEDTGHLPGAIREATLALEVEPESSRPPRELGYYHLQAGDFDAAEKWLLKAAGMNHLDVIACHYLGELYIKRQEFKQAQVYLEKAMKISPRHIARGLRFGRTLIRMSLPKRAIKVFESVLRLADKPEKLKEQIAGYCMAPGCFTYATELLESILRVHPDRKDLLFNLGQAYLGAGNVNQALVNLNAAESADPENDRIKLTLARCYLTIEKPIWGQRVLEKILRTDPDHTEALELRDQFIEMETAL